MDTLHNKIIVVTGAGGTIAGPVEEALVAQGARPILVDRDIVNIESRARSYSTQPIESDLMSAAAANAMVRAAKEQMGRIDGLIHLVGDVVMGDVDLLDAESYQLAFDTNVKTLFHTVQAVLPELREREVAFLGGISSGEAFLGGAPGASLFAASKSAVATFLRSLDRELAGTHVGVGIVTPMGLVDTLGNRRRHPDVDPAIMIAPSALGAAFVAAARSGRGGRLVELPVYPPRT